MKWFKRIICLAVGHRKARFVHESLSNEEFNIELGGEFCERCYKDF